MRETDFKKMQEERNSIVPLVDTPAAPREQMIWSQSRLSTYQMCEKKFYWNYVHPVEKDGMASRGIVIKHTPAPFVFGTVMHKGIQKMLGGSTLDDAIELATRLHDEAVTKALEAGLSDTTSLALQRTWIRPLLTGYAVKHLSKLGTVRNYSSFEFHLPETELHMNTWAGNGMPTLDGYIDYLAECIMPQMSGESISSNWIGEIKVTSNIQAMMEDAPLNNQISQYVWLWNKNFPEKKVSGILYDLVKKPGTRPHKNENLVQYETRLTGEVLKNLDDYFSRNFVIRDIHDLSMWREDTEITICDIHRKMNTYKLSIYTVAEKDKSTGSRMNNDHAAVWVRKTNMCTWRGKCPYLPLCRTWGEQRDNILKMLYEPKRNREESDKETEV